MVRVVDVEEGREVRRGTRRVEGELEGATRTAPGAGDGS